MLSSALAQEVSERWVARYDGPGGGNDWVAALVLDSEGNVYVTGESKGLGTGTDYATVKYSPEGEELWVARYNGIGGHNDGGYALALDTSGNVYVTGCSSEDYATVKYSPEGEELWVARYDGPRGWEDSAHALALDTAGNVYVTGTATGPDESSDYTTIKYSPEGEELWVAPYDGPVAPCVRIVAAHSAVPLPHLQVGSPHGGRIFR